MRFGKNPMTPLAAVIAGLVAGATGTECLDAVHYLKYRRAGGTGSPLAWVFAPSRAGRRPLTQARSPSVSDVTVAA
jgi:hypothetical protein